MGPPPHPCSTNLPKDSRMLSLLYQSPGSFQDLEQNLATSIEEKDVQQDNPCVEGSILELQFSYDPFVAHTGLLLKKKKTRGAPETWCCASVNAND